MSDKFSTIGIGTTVIILSAIIIAINAAVIMLIWNYAIVPVFGASPINFWIALLFGWGLSIIGSLIRGAVK